MAGNGGNSLREALQERGWSYTRLAAELRRHAGGLQLPKTESLVTLISRWVNNHQQPDDFYRDLLAKALGRSRADLFGDEGEPKLGVLAVPAELPHDVAGFIGRSGEIDDLRRRLLGTGRVASGAVVTIDGPPGVGKSALAVHLAHQLCEHFPNAQLFANL
jgi:transcriptional regulator with XRE-family HTH domain